MPSSYPGAADSFSTPTPSPTTTTTSTPVGGRTHSQRHDAVEDGLRAVQNDLVAARAHGGGFSSIANALSGLWAAISGKENAGTAAATLASHNAAADPHPQYLRTSEIVAGSNVTVTAPGDGTVVVSATGGGGGGGGVTDHGALTGLADDDHPQYLTNARGDARYEATGAVATHVAAADPHPQYETATEGAARITAHNAAADPHGDRAFASGLVDDLSGVTDAATARSNLGLGNSATRNVGTAGTDVAAGDAPAAAQAAAIAASAQRSANLSDLASATSARSNLGLGNSATRNVGTAAGTVAAGDDARLSDARTPSGPAGGDLTGNFPNPSIAPRAVTFPDIVAVPSARILGRATAGSGDVEALTATQAARVVGVESLRAALVNGTPRADAVMPNPPTLSMSTAGAATGIASSNLASPNAASFTYLGASMSNVGTVAGVTNCFRQTSGTLTDSTGQHLLNVEFETDSASVEFLLYSTNSNDAKVRLWVDGLKATDGPVAVGASGAWYRYRVTFPTSQVRRLRLEGAFVTFGGVQKPIVRSLWATTRDLGPRAVIVGDSYLLGISGTFTPGVFLDRPWVWDGWGARVGRYLGWNVFPSGVSGTGYLATNGGADVAYGTRFTSDVANLSPDIVVFSGGLNDQGLTLSSVQAAITSLMSACATALPSATVIVLEPFSPLNTYAANLTTIGGYLSTAAAANGFTYVSGCIGWITGTGTTVSATGAGNSDVYIAPDGYHPTAALGYPYLADRVTAALGANVRRIAGTPTVVSTAGPGLAPTLSGNSAQFLNGQGGWSNPSVGFGQTRLEHSVGYTLPASSSQYLPWNSEAFDDLNGHDNVTYNTRFTIPATGRYRFTAFLGVYIATGTNRSLLGEFMVNRTTSLGATSGVADGNGWAAYVLDSGWRTFTAGDYVEIRAEARGGNGDTYANTLYFCAERAL